MSSPSDGGGKARGAGDEMVGNGVGGCPGWTFGVLIRMTDKSVRFDLTHEDGRVIRGVVARSPYRYNDTAKLMEGESATGYEEVARHAIAKLGGPRQGHGT